MNPTARLLKVTDALTHSGLRFLIMGGHAVRYYGVDRNTCDFDFHVSSEDAPALTERLRKIPLFGAGLVEGPSWRANDFRRYQIGALPNGKEEWLEFWFRGHLLPPFSELYQRREDAEISAQTLPFLSLPDLIRSKETERDDDWADVRLLEEILDARNLAKTKDRAGGIFALSQLRSRRGFERAESAGLLTDHSILASAFAVARHPVTIAYLLPLLGSGAIGTKNLPLDTPVKTALEHVRPGTTRHLALVEAVRLAYQRAAKAADRADKQRLQSAQ